MSTMPIQEQIDRLLQVLAQYNQRTAPASPHDVYVRDTLSRVLALYPVEAGKSGEEAVGCCEVNGACHNNVTEANCKLLGGSWHPGTCEDRPLQYPCAVIDDPSTPS